MEKLLDMLEEMRQFLELPLVRLGGQPVTLWAVTGGAPANRQHAANNSIVLNWDMGVSSTCIPRTHRVLPIVEPFRTLRRTAP